MIHTTSIIMTWLLAVSGGGLERGPQQDLADAQQKWALHKVENYQFTFQARCFCESEFVRPVTFRINHGTSVLVTDVHERVRRYFHAYNTVEKLFEFVRSALNRGAFKLVVVYDADLGYPRSVEVDYRQLTKDDEMYFRVTNFKVLSEQRPALDTPPNTYQPSPRQVRRSSPSGRRVKKTRDRKNSLRLAASAFSAVFVSSAGSTPLRRRDPNTY